MTNKKTRTRKKPAHPTQRGKKAIALLDEWLADESGYDEQNWPELKEALDRDRLSSRRFFNG